MVGITYSKGAVKVLLAMDRKTAQRIAARMAQYAANPAALANNVKTLKGSGLLALRVGDWRVIFERTGDTLTVLKVGPRGGVYRS